MEVLQILIFDEGKRAEEIFKDDKAKRYSIFNIRLVMRRLIEQGYAYDEVINGTMEWGNKYSSAYVPQYMLELVKKNYEYVKRTPFLKVEEVTIMDMDLELLKRIEDPNSRMIGFLFIFLFRVYGKGFKINKQDIIDLMGRKVNSTQFNIAFHELKQYGLFKIGMRHTSAICNYTPDKELLDVPGNLTSIGFVIKDIWAPVLYYERWLGDKTIIDCKKCRKDI